MKNSWLLLCVFLSVHGTLAFLVAVYSFHFLFVFNNRDVAGKADSTWLNSTLLPIN